MVSGTVLVAVLSSTTPSLLLAGATRTVKISSLSETLGVPLGESQATSDSSHRVALELAV